jgi:hypothetical protein
MKFIFSLFAILISVHICKSDPAQKTDTGDLNDGLIASLRGDISEAIQLLNPLAERGHPLAQLLLGRIYLQSISMPPDCGAGEKWLIRAAEQDNAEAASDLGDLYKQGVCVGKSDEIALRWYLKAARKGYATAQFEVAEIYLKNTNGAPDYAESLRWLIQAVKHFDKDASLEIGRMYSQGLGIRTDHQEAFKWFELASLLTPPFNDDWQRVLTLRDNVREKLSPLQVVNGQADALRLLEALIKRAQSPAAAQIVDALLLIQQ